jgi:hypothetical protein
VKTVKIKGSMTLPYGDNCRSQRKIYELVEEFGRGWTIVADVALGDH